MSLLKSIKGTFQSVQQDFSLGIRSLTVSGSDVAKITPTVATGGLVNYDVGADLLQKHELIWRDLYQTTADTARNAEDVDARISDLYVYYDRQCELLARFHSEAANLPVLLGQLQEVTDSLAGVEEAYDRVESALVHLENTWEGQELQRHTHAHQAQLHAYKQKKSQELDRMKVQLAREHSSKMDVRNRQRQSLLKERQSAFQDQFSQDIDYYRKHGKPARLDSTPESERKLDIAEIEVEADEDVKAFDEFLASTDADTTRAAATERCDTQQDTSDDVEAEATHLVITADPDNCEAGEPSTNEKHEQQQPGETSTNVEHEQQQPGETSTNVEHEQQQPGETSTNVEHEQQQPGVTSTNVEHEQQQPGETSTNVEHEQQQPGETSTNEKHEQQQPGETSTNVEHEQQQPGETSTNVEHEPQCDVSEQRESDNGTEQECQTQHVTSEQQDP